MSAFNALCPLLRRSAQVPWTCHACLRRQGPRLRNGFATTIETSAQQAGNAGKRRSRRRWIVVGAGLGVAGAGVVAVNEDARHAYVAVQRSSRVLATLFANVKDYRDTLKHGQDEGYQDLLKACHLRCAKRTLRTLEKNGSIFIKLGQHLSSLNYLLPNEWCDTFIPLQDKCPVSSYESIKEMVMQDEGTDLAELFSEFEPLPIGAASLAQVHRAVVRETGEKVAVKVQHPALDEWAKLDLALTRFTFETLKYWFPEYDLTWLSEEMEKSLPQELDFRQEGHNAMRAREYFSHVPDAPVIIPAVLWAKRRILVMQYVSGARPDDLEYLDTHGIDRDEVSAALARIFNEMIFGTNAPLHCDPHGGNIAIRHNPHSRRNFDVVLYDHGLYRDIPLPLRRAYAKLWLAVLDADEARMRRYAREVAGITDDEFPLFASAITGRDYSVLVNREGVSSRRSETEKEFIGEALGDGMLESLIQLLGRVPRVILLILKTNDLTRSLDENLHTRQGPARTFLILARYASRTVYEEQLEALGGLSLLWPRNFLAWLRAWSAHLRVELKLEAYETYLKVRALLGMGHVGV